MSPPAAPPPPRATTSPNRELLPLFPTPVGAAPPAPIVRVIVAPGVKAKSFVVSTAPAPPPPAFPRFPPDPPPPTTTIVDAEVTPVGTVQVQFLSLVVVLNSRVIYPPLRVEVGEQETALEAVLEVAVYVLLTLVKPLFAAVNVNVADVPAFKPVTLIGSFPVVAAFPIETIPAVVVAL